MAIDYREERSFTGLVSDLVSEARDLFRTEGRLIRSEISEKLSQLQIAGGALVGGAICLLVALVVLAQALVIALTVYMEPGWAALVVGAAFAVLGVLFLAKARSNLKPTNLAPERTAEQLRKDGRLVKEHAK